MLSLNNLQNGNQQVHLVPLINLNFEQDQNELGLQMLPWDKTKSTQENTGSVLKGTARNGHNAYMFAKAGASLVGGIWGAVDPESKKQNFDPYYNKAVQIKDALKQTTGGWETVYNIGDEMKASAKKKQQPQEEDVELILLPWDKTKSTQENAGSVLKGTARNGANAYKFAKTGAALVGGLWGSIDPESKKKNFDPYYNKAVEYKDKIKGATGGWETVYNIGDEMKASARSKQQPQEEDVELILLPWDKTKTDQENVGSVLKGTARNGANAYKFAKSGAQLVGGLWGSIDPESKKQNFDPYYNKAVELKDNLKQTTGGWETVYNVGEELKGQRPESIIVLY